MSERRLFDAATVVLAGAALSQLPALGTLVVDHAGHEPIVRAAALAGALAAGAAALRRRGHPALAWVAAPVLLVLFGRLLDLFALGASEVAGSAVSAPLSAPLRALAALLAGSVLGAVIGLGGAALARSHRSGLFFASLAATFAFVPDAPREIGAGMGALALAAWSARTLEPRRHEGTKNDSFVSSCLRGSNLFLVIGIAGPIALAPIAGRLVALSGSAPALVALVAALGLAIGARIGRAPALAVAAPLLAAAAVLAAPPVAALLVLVGLAAGAAGLALRVQPLALALAALLGAGLEQGLLAAAERTWSNETKMAVAGARGDQLLSFGLSAHGAVAVVDSRAGNVRELRRDGVLLGSVAIGRGSAQADVATPVLASVLAQLLGRSGGHVACLGFGDGIAAATLGRTSGLTDLFLVEPDPSIRALRDDPGDLFHGAWKETWVSVVPEDARSFLRRSSAGFDAVLDLEDLLAETGALRLAKDRLVAGGALVRIVRDGPRFREEASEFARIFRDQALAFRVPLSRGTAILMGGVAAIDTQRPLAPGLARSLAIVRLPESDILGTYAAGPEGLKRARSVADLSPAGGDAALLARLLGEKDALLPIADSHSRLGETRNALLLVAAARELGAQPAFELDRAEGDARFAAGDDAGAVACWERALAAAPKATSPRLSLAARHYKRRELDPARKLLEEGLTGDERRDAPLRYLLGRIALTKYEFKAAREHFEAARGFEDADERAVVAKKLEDQAAEMKAPERGPAPSLEQKDAKRLVREARALLEDAAKKEADQIAYCRAHNLTVSDEHRMQLRQQRRDACYLLEVAAKKEPGDAAIRLELGRGKRALGDFRGAIEELETAARLDPNENRALYALGDLLRETGEREAALDAYERGLARGKITTASGRVYLAYADILVEERRYADAAAKLEEGERLAEGVPTIPVNLGAIYERLGRNADAVRAYRRYLDLVGPEGGDPEVRRRVNAAIARLEGR